MNPIQFLTESIKKVPVLKYALGVVGIAAAIAIINSFSIGNTKLPLIPILILFGFMILLFIFSTFLKSKDTKIRFAGYVLIYTVLIIVCVSAILIVTAVIFDWPQPLTKLLK